MMLICPSLPKILASVSPVLAIIMYVHHQNCPGLGNK